jgi:hypothetical protein
MSSINNVFISHHGEDDEHVQALKARLAERGCELRNSSVDSTKPNNANNEDYIKQKLRERISWAGTFICLIGYETYNREWVEWEIEQAHQMGKRIIGVFAYGAAQDAEIPEGLKMYRDSLVGWQIDKIIDTIENNTYYSEKPDGSPSTTDWSGSKEEC